MRHSVPRQTLILSEAVSTRFASAGRTVVGLHAFLNGTIDELRLYNQALTQSQIQSEMNTPIGAAAAVRPLDRDSTAEPKRHGRDRRQTFLGHRHGQPLHLHTSGKRNGVAISGATSTSYTTPATNHIG